MKWRNVALLFKKELKSAIRDRRTALLVVIFPLLFYPLMLGTIMHFTGRGLQNSTERVSSVLYVGRKASPSLADAFRKEEKVGVRYLESEREAQKAYERGEGDVVVLAEKTGKDNLKVELRYSRWQSESELALSRIQELLQAYLKGRMETKLAELGLDYRELSPPLQVEVVNTGTENLQLGREMIKVMLPYFIVLAIMTAAMGLGAEITAGEKEKRTISTLLVSRLSREEIVIGKFLAVFVVASFAAFLAVVGLVYGLSLMGFQLGLGGMGPISLGEMVLTLLPLVGILSSLVIIIGSFARTQKEANIYQTPILMTVVLIGILSMSGGLEMGEIVFLLPLINSLEAFKEIIEGGASLSHLGLTFLSNFTLAGLSIYFSIRLFKEEKILFRN